MGKDGEPWTWVVGEDDPKFQPAELHKTQLGPMKVAGRVEEITNNKNSFCNGETTISSKQPNGHVAVNDG